MGMFKDIHYILQKVEIHKISICCTKNLQGIGWISESLAFIALPNNHPRHVEAEYFAKATFQ